MTVCTYCFKPSVWMVGESSWFLNTELIQQQEWIKVSELWVPNTSTNACTHAFILFTTLHNLLYNTWHFLTWFSRGLYRIWWMVITVWCVLIIYKHCVVMALYSCVFWMSSFKHFILWSSVSYLDVELSAPDKINIRTTVTSICNNQKHTFTQISRVYIS